MYKCTNVPIYPHEVVPPIVDSGSILNSIHVVAPADIHTFIHPYINTSPYKHPVELVSLTYPLHMARSCPVRSKPSKTIPV